MTGQFSDIDQRRCSHYARFMKDLSLTQANAVFWSLFVLVLAMMCVSSWQHHRSNNLLDLEKSLPASELSSNPHREMVFHKRRGYFCIVVLCFLFSVICIVLECFALFNIEFCDGEDLTQLYWGFWSILQVGSLIAIAGVLMQFWIILSGVGTPPWAVALGTPVLVLAALGWMFKHIFHSAWHKYRNRYMCGDEDDNESAGGEEKRAEDGQGVDRWISRAPTLIPESGFASHNEPVEIAHITNGHGIPEPLKRTPTM